MHEAEFKSSTERMFCRNPLTSTITCWERGERGDICFKSAKTLSEVLRNRWEEGGGLVSTILGS